MTCDPDQPDGHAVVRFARDVHGLVAADAVASLRRERRDPITRLREHEPQATEGDP